MKEIKQAAIEHATVAVRNLRRSLSLGFSVAEPSQAEQDIHNRQQEKLRVWEYIVAALTLPVDPTFEELHHINVLLQGEMEHMIQDIKSRDEKLELQAEQIKRYREVSGDKIVGDISNEKV